MTPHVRVKGKIRKREGGGERSKNPFGPGKSVAREGGKKLKTKARDMLERKRGARQKKRESKKKEEQKARIRLYVERGRCKAQGELVTLVEK